jgi:hypothetical protein
MKKKDLISLYNALKKVEGKQFSVKFSYFVAKNKVLLKDEITALEEAAKPNPKFLEFDEKRVKLASDMADRDENGKPKVQNNSFTITEKFNKFREELDALRKKYNQDIIDQEKSVKEFEDILNEDFNYKGTKIDFKNIPDEIEPSFLEILIVADLITEEQKE